jgi:hypothetical protein
VFESDGSFINMGLAAAKGFEDRRGILQYTSPQVVCLKGYCYGGYTAGARLVLGVCLPWVTTQYIFVLKW